jgi:hypothetical protein
LPSNASEKGRGKGLWQVGEDLQLIPHPVVFDLIFFSVQVGLDGHGPVPTPTRHLVSKKKFASEGGKKDD